MTRKATRALLDVAEASCRHLEECVDAAIANLPVSTNGNGKTSRVAASEVWRPARLKDTGTEG